MQLHFFPERFCIECARLILPCDDHLAIYGFFCARIYCNKICLRVIRKGIICHRDHKIPVTVIFIDFCEIFAVIQTFLHIHVIHGKEVIRNAHFLHFILQIAFHVRCIRKIKHIFQRTGGI